MNDRLRGTITVGRTVRVKEFEFFRVEASAEFFLDAGPGGSTMEAQFDTLKGQVDEMAKRGNGSPGPSAAKDGPATPETAAPSPSDKNGVKPLNAQENEPSNVDVEKVLQKSIHSLTWKDNRWGAWAFAKTQQGTTTPGAEDLVAAIQSSKDGKLFLGGEVFSFSGDGDKFISRKKAQKK